MPTPKKIKKSKCSPQIWKKFSLLEQLVWNDLYAEFTLLEETFPPEWCGKKNAKNREVVAHNMACHGVWVLKSLLNSYVNKKSPKR